MNDDELRRALEGYAAAAPSGDPRPGLHARLARRRRMRAVAGIAAAAAFVAGTGAAVVLDGDRPSGVLVAADPSDSATPDAAPTTPTPSPSTPAMPAPSVSRAQQPMPSTSPPPTPETSTPSATPEPEGEPVTATGEGEDGLRVRVTLDPGNPATARPAVLVVQASDDDGSIHVASVDWGDGAGEASARTAMCEPDPPLGTRREPTPDTSVSRFEHAWRHPGELRVRVRVESELQCQDDPAPEEAVVEVVASVRPGLVTSNGPSAPWTPELEVRDTGEAPRDVEVVTQVGDADGYVRAAVVDWGDGTTSTVTNELACGDGEGRHYPQHGSLHVEAAHVYARPGTYEVTVRYASTGCGGEDAQRASASESFQVS